MKTDKDIEKDIIEELEWTPILKDSKICVEVKDGDVYLDGYVTSYPQKVAAEKTALHIKGVKSVTKNLNVHLPESLWLSDNRLAENIRTVLNLIVTVPIGIEVKVSEGIITLKGEVEFGYQKEAVENAVAPLKGVKAVNNEINVKTAINTTLIQENIRKALERRIDREAENITIEASGNKVVLGGKVHSWNEKRDAAHAAWSAPGVAIVEDQIIIEYD